MIYKYDFFIKVAFECFREDAEKDSQKAMRFVECLSDAPIYIREKYRDFITQRVFDDDFANALAGDMCDARIFWPRCILSLSQRLRTVSIRQPGLKITKSTANSGAPSILASRFFRVENKN